MSSNTHTAPCVINFFTMSPLNFKGSHITIGNYDGVHLGHQEIIKNMVDKAKPSNKPIIVVTFFPNPSDFFNTEVETFYLSTPEQKKSMLLELGVDSVITFHFDKGFSELSAKEFLTGLKQKLGLETLVVGWDFVMGKNRQGTIEVIKSIAQELSFSVETIEPVKQGEKDISSTKIRQLLDEGRISDATQMLGRHYSVSGEVIHGSDRGSRIGLPTANIAYWPQKKLPSVGVYATLVGLQDHEFLGITNVGYRPTFEVQETQNIETHILDFDGNIYGEKLKLKFVQKIRDEQKFSGVEAFLAQIERDKATAQRIFSDDKT